MTLATHFSNSVTGNKPAPADRDRRRQVLAQCQSISGRTGADVPFIRDVFECREFLMHPCLIEPDHSEQRNKLIDVRNEPQLTR